MSFDASFERLLLSQARAEAKRLRVKLPLRIVALKVGRQQYAVQADHPHNFDHYVSASSATEAKAKWIGQLIDKAIEAANNIAVQLTADYLATAARRTAIGNTPTCEGCGEPQDHCICPEVA